MCLKIVYPQTQWFCWSLSLWKMAVSLGILTQHFQTNPHSFWPKTPMVFVGQKPPCFSRAWHLSHQLGAGATPWNRHWGMSMDWFKGKIAGKPHDFMGKSMVSCRFSLKPIHWEYGRNEGNLRIIPTFESSHQFSNGIYLSLDSIMIICIRH